MQRSPPTKVPKCSAKNAKIWSQKPWPSSSRTHVKDEQAATFALRTRTLYVRKADLSVVLLVHLRVSPTRDVSNVDADICIDYQHHTHSQAGALRRPAAVSPAITSLPQARKQIAAAQRGDPAPMIRAVGAASTSLYHAQSKSIGPALLPAMGPRLGESSVGASSHLPMAPPPNPVQLLSPYAAEAYAHPPSGYTDAHRYYQELLKHNQNLAYKNVQCVTVNVSVNYANLKNGNRVMVPSVSEVLGNVPVHINSDDLLAAAYTAVLYKWYRWSDDMPLLPSDLEMRDKHRREILPGTPNAILEAFKNPSKKMGVAFVIQTINKSTDVYLYIKDFATFLKAEERASRKVDQELAAEASVTASSAPGQRRPTSATSQNTTSTSLFNTGSVQSRPPARQSIPKQLSNGPDFPDVQEIIAAVELNKVLQSQEDTVPTAQLTGKRRYIEIPMTRMGHPMEAGFHQYKAMCY
ncbi:hypothetical protein OF83DRAFT_924488 [Amylostereum chailletii]|nr:hypothetical protein OF83DRAFT_924488 [Amylostereum chailletii]